MTITPGMYPSSTGWSYPDQGVVLSASNFIDLVTKVASFRARNGFPAGDPVNEVKAYICQKNPSICKNCGKGMAVTQAPSGAPFGDAVVSWMVQAANAALSSALEPELILARAEACRNCPLNVDFRPACTSCARKPLALEKAVAAGNPAGANTGLGGCQRYRWSNRMAILMRFEEDPKAPVGCWRRPK